MYAEYEDIDQYVAGESARMVNSNYCGVASTL